MNCHSFKADLKKLENYEINWTLQLLAMGRFNFGQDVGNIVHTVA
jgi:hypothetical protein